MSSVNALGLSALRAACAANFSWGGGSTLMLGVMVQVIQTRIRSSSSFPTFRGMTARAVSNCIFGSLVTKPQASLLFATAWLKGRGCCSTAVYCQKNQICNFCIPYHRLHLRC